ncbi:hypothetical protein COU60_01140 [Candidatus Pacearchaeota archaeon CG10_big_fil_rev_8_21_14_0_10_34_76]|nr:MAG: hypothetical protein COU60_01140 [Candidatus Pacearchaeota archaeon CG10_big_fil_rev_8_21_14_0_10_34_76]
MRNLKKIIGLGTAYTVSLAFGFAKGISTEIGLPITDTYLDDALMTGFPFIGAITGGITFPTPSDTEREMEKYHQRPTGMEYALITGERAVGAGLGFVGSSIFLGLGYALGYTGSNILNR